MDRRAEQVHHKDVEVVFHAVVVALGNRLSLYVRGGVEVGVDLVFDAELTVAVLDSLCLDCHVKLLVLVDGLPNSTERPLAQLAEIGRAHV